MITVKNVYYTLRLPRGEKNILDNISLKINKGDGVAILGRTGSGKTTLINHIAGILMPTSGNVVIDGVEINKNSLSEIRKKIGMVFQFPQYQLFEDTVYKDIAYGLNNMGLIKSEIHRRITHVAASLEFDEKLLNMSPYELSDGDKRKAAIAGVLVMNPEILILDEPSAGLDIESRKQFFDLLLNLKNHQEKTIIVVSHNIEDILHFTNRLIVMDCGKIVFDGDVKSMMSRYDDFIGCGVQLPRISLFMKTLKQHFENLNDNTFTINHAKQEILRILKR